MYNVYRGGALFPPRRDHYKPWATTRPLYDSHHNKLDPGSLPAAFPCKSRARVETNTTYKYIYMYIYMYRICILKVAICILASRQAVRSCAGHCACMSRERPCVRDHRYQWQGNLPIAVHTTKKPQPCFSLDDSIGAMGVTTGHVTEVVPGKNDWCDRKKHLV